MHQNSAIFTAPKRKKRLLWIGFTVFFWPGNTGFPCNRKSLASGNFHCRRCFVGKNDPHCRTSLRYLVCCEKSVANGDMQFLIFVHSGLHYEPLSLSRCLWPMAVNGKQWPKRSEKKSISSTKNGNIWQSGPFSGLNLGVDNFTLKFKGRTLENIVKQGVSDGA